MNHINPRETAVPAGYIAVPLGVLATDAVDVLKAFKAEPLALLAGDRQGPRGRRWPWRSTSTPAVVMIGQDRLLGRHDLAQAPSLVTGSGSRTVSMSRGRMTISPSAPSMGRPSPARNLFEPGRRRRSGPILTRSLGRRVKSRGGPMVRLGAREVGEGLVDAQRLDRGESRGVEWHADHRR